MIEPDEQQWLRVEELGRQLTSLRPELIPEKVADLVSSGESPTVITLLRTWLVLPPPPTAFEVGTPIGHRFVLREKMGEGAMGSVWRARQEMIARDVAVKLIHPSIVTAPLRARFMAEIEVLGKLNHPGIVRIFDAGFHEWQGGESIPFFAMELIEGVGLDVWADEHRFNRSEVLKITVEICEALQSAHEHRIVHRDLKPSNIMIRPNGQPVVVDFGIARLTGVILGEEEGTFSGTPRYAAPEQHLGRDGDFRSGESVDVYAMGVILFEMLTGRRLFSFEGCSSLTEMRRVVLEAPVPQLSEIISDCSQKLNDVLARALRRDPADRFYSMRALNRALRQVMASNAATLKPAPWQASPGGIVPGTHWVLVEKIGEGGAGQVWLGRHSQLGETRVFKFCNTEETARTLKRELTLFRLLKDKVGRNPHFIPLREVSLDEAPYYLMMDYCEAQDLEAWAESQPGGLANLPESIRLEIVAQAAEALQAAHEAGIIHRDIKPANLLVRGHASSGEVHVFVADFGIGQIVVNQLLREGTRLGFSDTVFGMIGSPLQGTALYLAPEVLEGSAATARSDIYSLGVVFWQMMTGHLRAAVDAAGWSDQISDPLLREDLARCLAGKPEKRWSSAGELGACLRSLPARRKEAERRRNEAAMRERAAYRRGILRASAVATAVVAAFAFLAAVAWVQRRETLRAHGELALKQALSQVKTDMESGRRARGLSLLETAAQTVTNAPALRTACAAILGMSDLISAPAEQGRQPVRNDPSIPRLPDEIARTRSHQGSVVAIARDKDGLNGEIDLFDAAAGKKAGSIERRQFPWVPLAEPALFCFSPSDKVIAIGGSVTSRQVLLCRVPDGSVLSYLYHNSDPLCCAWHPGGRIIAVGCADGTTRVWDSEGAASPTNRATAGSQFDLPPTLDVPAQDEPFQVLRGHRGAVAHLAFSADGRWLVSLDAAGYLRVWTEPCPASLSQSPEPRQNLSPLAFSAELRLEEVRDVTGIETMGDSVVIRHASGQSEAFEYVPAELPSEIPVAPGITDVAWDEEGGGLCCGTMTDLYWMKSQPLEIMCAAYGQNPMGISRQKQGKEWFVGTGHGLTEWVLTRNEDQWTNHLASRFTLSGATAGQATRTALATDGKDRTAAYCGKRIQFFDGGQPGALDKSIIADGGDGVFNDIFWDQPGRLIGVSFRQRNGGLRLESWGTSTNFPPGCQTLGAHSLDCQFVVPANDGFNCLARGEHRGLWRFNPANGEAVTLDGSVFARQNAPLAVTSDGSLAAMVVDQAMIRLVELPSGKYFADLQSARQAGLTMLAWDVTGRQLSSVTEDGFIQVWNLGPWREWLARHRLEE